jgi:hypothetical protein
MDIFALISLGLENVLYAGLGSAITAILGGIGYLIKRKVEQKPQLDVLEVSERALKLLKEITTQNLTIDEFHVRREQILNPHKSPGKQNQQVLVGVTRLQLTQLSSTKADTELIEGLELRFRVEDRLYKQINQEEAAMFAALQALLDALYARKAFSEAMDIIESQNNWRKCWPDLNAVTAKYEDSGVSSMFYHSEFAAVMSDRAIFLQRRLREIEQRKESEPTPGALIDDERELPKNLG